MVNRPQDALPAVTLAVVILLAGCAGVPTTDQQTQTPESTVENFSYPPGWSQEGITVSNVSTALQTHSATVKNTSRKSRLTTISGGKNRTIVRTLDADAGTAEIRFVDTSHGTDSHTYYNADGVCKYDRISGELEQRPGEDWERDRVASHEGLRRPLLSLEINATETVIVEGTTAVRYTVTGIRDPDFVPANTATGHIIVAEEGYIAEFNITRGNDKFTQQTIYEVSEFGNATVPRPAWMPEK
ncbi:hypothetical protein [Haloarcula argentinensis]|uniref:Lipoprotein n=1 Tax=Haloarcula argentinensis TaxID=43776 RepID=A0A830FWZ8_HALAR|nr:hypothetical protein [Haloarcula argentinensis]GGM47886.1 hypothetical protein GCM10009006_31350 [Haloarcula argentinensis]